MKYYEIISSVGVIGVTTTDGLLHAATEDRVEYFGEISKADFKRFGDHPWLQPKSEKRFRPQVEQVSRMTPISSKENKIEPKTMFTDAVNSFLAEITRIDNATPWQETEPEWWLAMMDIERFIRNRTENLNISDKRQEGRNVNDSDKNQTAKSKSRNMVRKTR